MSYELLCRTWFLLLGALLVGYAILDGFDLGVGIMHLFARGDRERRTLMNSIGPLWDGNEVWLVTFGGAMFAAFPHAYATIFSGFYLAFVALLFALIFRGISMEFRSKLESNTWRSFWDFGFFAGSALAALLFGVAVGNAMIGMPIGQDLEYAGSFFDQLSPYALLVGAMTVALFAMHGSIYLLIKTEGDLQARVVRWSRWAYAIFISLYLVTTIATLIWVPRATHNFSYMPWAWGVATLNVVILVYIPRGIRRGHNGKAFLASSASIAILVFLFSLALYPNLVTSSIDPNFSLTIYNAASSAKTLGIMLIIAVIGMPLVVTYTISTYWVFRGKVQLSEMSY